MIRISALSLSILLHAALLVLTVFGIPYFADERPIADRLVIVEVVNLAEVTNAPPPSEVTRVSELPPEAATAPEQPRPAPPPPPPPAPRPQVEPPSPPEPSVSAPAPAPPPEPPRSEPQDVAEPEAPPPPAPVERPEVEVATPTEPEPAQVAEAPTPEPVETQLVEPEQAEVQETPQDPVPVPVERPTPPARQVAEAPEPEPEAPQDSFLNVLRTVEDLRRAAPRREAETPPNPQSAAIRSNAQTLTNPDRPLSVSELDAIRRQISNCWLVPAGAKNAEDLVVAARVFMRQDRTVQSVEILDSARMASDPFFRAAAESAIRALRNPSCSPLELPPEKYESWRTFTITFNPRDMLS